MPPQLFATILAHVFSILIVNWLTSKVLWRVVVLRKMAELGNSPERREGGESAFQNLKIDFAEIWF